MFENFATLDPEVMMEMESMRLEFEKDDELKSILIAEGIVDDSSEVILNDNDLPF